MDTFAIVGGTPLFGDVYLSGAKNSVLKLIAASMLAAGETVLYNVPRISDVESMLRLVGATGVDWKWLSSDVLAIEVPERLNPDVAIPEAEKIRASVVAMGPLLCRCGEVKITSPGGDDLGLRPINLHLDGFVAMGAEVSQSGKVISARAAKLHGVNIRLPFPSVGATENLLLAAVGAEGKTVIENAAREPEITDLASMLNRMGANINGAGSSTITIEGIKIADLHATEHTVIPDRIEAATFIAAVGSAGGEIMLYNARPDHLTMLTTAFGDIGVRVAPNSDGVWVGAAVGKRRKATDIATLPFPGFATDYKPFIVAALCTAEGTSVITENLFTDRFQYFDELRLMGADIDVDAHHAVIRGVKSLHKAKVRSHDIRGGAALIVAALGVPDLVEVTDAHHVMRGYQELDVKLSALGANVQIK